MGIDEAIKKAVALIHRKDYVSFVELTREIPEMAATQTDRVQIVYESLPKKAGVCVIWEVSRFGADVYDRLKSHVSLKVTDALPYLIDGATIYVEPPDEITYILFRPKWFATIIAMDGSYVHLSDDQLKDLRKDKSGREILKRGKTRLHAVRNSYE